MRKLNVFDFETVDELKSIEISCSNILDLKEKFDVLIISAFQNDYKPLPKTIIGALDNIGIDVNSLAQKPFLDMRGTRHVWLSHEIANEKLNFKRIACVEFSVKKGIPIKMAKVKERIESLFGMISAANYSGVDVRSISMALIGANAQDYSADKMAELILSEGYHALEAISQFDRLRVSELNIERFESLSKAFNNFLGRNDSDTASDVLYDSTKKIIKQMKQDFVSLKMNNKIKLDSYNLDSVIASFNTLESDPRYMVAFKCRRLAEIAAIDILTLNNMPTSGTLQQKIDKICSELNLAGWTKLYWHTIRALGNEGVHIKDVINKKHQIIKYHHPNANDINILLLCSAEILHMWREMREKC